VTQEALPILLRLETGYGAGAAMGACHRAATTVLCAPAPGGRRSCAGESIGTIAGVWDMCFDA
jgi:hypothetical protein